MTTSIDVTNRALAQIGTRSQITSFTDGSSEALYAGLLYNSIRDFMLREGDYDFSLQTAGAVATTGSVPGWLFAYNHPIGALRIRQMVPSVFTNILDPTPVEWNIANSGGVKKIFTKEAMQLIVYTAAPASEDLWEPMFTEAFVRMFASALAFALENRIEASKMKLDEAMSFAGIANLRDG